jgi:hypothetical protein
LLIPPFRKAICRKLTKSFTQNLGKTSGFAHSSKRTSSFRKDSDDIIDV